MINSSKKCCASGQNFAGPDCTTSAISNCLIPNDTDDDCVLCKDKYYNDTTTDPSTCTLKENSIDPNNSLCMHPYYFTTSENNCRKLSAD